MEASHNFRKKFWPPAVHVLVWLVLFILPNWLIYLDSGYDRFFLYRNIISILLYAVIFYSSYFFLAPVFFFRRKKTLYFISTASLVIACVITMRLAERTLMRPRSPEGKPPPEAMQGERPFPGPGVLPPPAVQGQRPPPPPDAGPPPQGDRPAPMMQKKNTPPSLEEKRPHPSKEWPLYNFLLTSLIIAGFALGLRFSRQLERKEAERKEAEKSKVEADLAFLRNQINPHFFFNTLNNIYSLVQTSTEDGQKAIHRLSKMMRYLLYETQNEYVRLVQEIEFLKNYIELEKLRLSDTILLTVVFPEETPGVMVPPLVFLPFVENAFKHGITLRAPSFLTIMMNIQGKNIRFECSNSISANRKEFLSSGNGIGLENIRKRLALLFPGRYDLEIFSTDSSYNVILSLDVSQCKRY